MNRASWGSDSSRGRFGRAGGRASGDSPRGDYGSTVGAAPRPSAGLSGGGRSLDRRARDSTYGTKNLAGDSRKGRGGPSARGDRESGSCLGDRDAFSRGGSGAYVRSESSAMPTAAMPETSQPSRGRFTDGYGSPNDDGRDRFPRDHGGFKGKARGGSDGTHGAPRGGRSRSGFAPSLPPPPPFPAENSIGSSGCGSAPSRAGSAGPSRGPSSAFASARRGHPARRDSRSPRSPRRPLDSRRDSPGQRRPIDGRREKKFWNDADDRRRREDGRHYGAGKGGCRGGRFAEDRGRERGFGDERRPGRFEGGAAAARDNERMGYAPRETDGAAWRKEDQQSVDEQRRMKERRRADEEMQKEDAERKRREEAERQRRQEETWKEEQRAAMALRVIFQQVQAATPETFEGLQKELEEELEKESRALGSQLQKMKGETQKVLSTASKRIEAILEGRKIEAEREKTEAARKEDLERCLTELSDLTDVAEAKTDLLKEAIEPMSNENLGVDDIGPLMAAINEQGEEAQAAHATCRKFILANKLMAVDQSQASLSTVRAELGKLVSRVNESAGLAQQLLQDTRLAKAVCVKKIAARRKLAQDDALFKRYDADGDGHWNKEEIVFYAKAEFDFDFSAEMADRFFDLCVPKDEPGIQRERLQQIVKTIGIARDHARGQLLRAEREERERREAEEKAARREQVEQVQKGLEERFRAMITGEGGLEALEGEVVICEERVRPIFGKGATSMEIDELSALVRELSAMSETLGEHLISLGESIEAIASEESVPELTEFVQLEVKKLKMRAERLQARQKRVRAAVENGRQASAQRTSAEVEKLRGLIIDALRSHMSEKNLSIEALFGAMDTDADGHLSEADFVGLLQQIPSSELSAQQITRFFAHTGTATSAQGRISLPEFLKLLKVYYKVVETTVITSGLSIRDGKVVRRLQVGEIIEVFEGPRDEENARLMRIRGKAVADGAEGWVTVAGNQGTRYLEEGGSLCKVLAEFELEQDPEQTTEASGSTPEKLRMAKKGEVLEVLEWAKDGKGKETGMGGMRVRCRAKSDGVTGWATMKDGTGAELLEIV